MKVYKVELLIIDFDELGLEGIKHEIINVSYPNECMSPRLMDIEERDVGEWDDDQPLNYDEEGKKEYKRLFKTGYTVKHPMWIIEFEEGVWIAEWEGDPPRTLVKNNARNFSAFADAEEEIERLKKLYPHRRWSNAKVIDSD